MTQNYADSARDRLLNAVLDARWHDGLLSIGVIFGDPEPDIKFGSNTHVRFQTFHGQAYRGTFLSHLNRDFIMDVIPQDSTLPLPEGVTSTAELLPAIFTTFGVRLTLEDIIVEPWVPGQPLRANPRSLGWSGTITFDTGELLYPPDGYLFLRTTDNHLVIANGKYVIVRIP